MASGRVAVALLAIVVVLAAACTGGAGTEGSADMTGRCSPGPGCRIVIVSGDARYSVLCSPVAEALVDVELPHEPRRRAIRAITGVASTQGVAVLWRDPSGCGLWALALADGLSESTAAAITQEVARGVERFGVTASPVPDDPAEG